MITGELLIKGHKKNVLPVVNSLDCINRIEAVPEKSVLTDEYQLTWKIEYKQTKINSQVQLELLDGKVLTIPLTELCKVEISNERITIYGKSYDIF